MDDSETLPWRVNKQTGREWVDKLSLFQLCRSERWAAGVQKLNVGQSSPTYETHREQTQDTETVGDTGSGNILT